MFNVDLSSKANALCLMVRIEMDGSSRIFGSGFFFMEQGIVATAKHIMKDHEDSRTPCFLRVQSLGSSQSYRPVQCLYHSEQDLALVILDSPCPDVRPLHPALRTEAGFVYIAYDPVRKTPFIKPVPLFRTDEIHEHEHSTARFFEWDEPTQPGNSGGPLIATDGGVAALLSGVSREAQSADCGGNLAGTTRVRARAVWIEPLVDLYFGWKANPGSVPREDFPFSGS